MKVFVSSRMGHLLERKAAIDAIHHAGQLPRYIETEEFHEELPVLKTIMDTMMEHSGAFVGIYLPGFGTTVSELGNLQPIMYELREMLNNLKEKGLAHEIPQRVLLLRSGGLEGSDLSQLSGIFGSLPEDQRPTMIQIEDYADVCSEVFEFARKLTRNLEETVSTAQRFSLDIEYTGMDQPGILQDLSEFLFTQHGVNIESVFGAAQGSRASIQLTAAWDDSGGVALDPEHLQKELNALWDGLAREQDVRADPVRVFSNGEGDQNLEFGYVEIRSIDAPGQLNTVCKALHDLELNMHQIHLAPAPSEFPRQTVISIKIPLDRKSEGMSRRAKFLKLETKLRALVGVQALATRYSGRIEELSRRRTNPVDGVDDLETNAC